MNRRFTFRCATLLVVLALFSAGPKAGTITSLRDPLVPEKVFLRVDEALELAFPRCEVKRGTVYLSKDQKKRVGDLAELRVATGIIYPYEAFDKKTGKLVGTAYFDTHIVRNKKESLMIVVDPESKIQRIEVCAFQEPLDYIPSDRWFAQFDKKGLSKTLQLRKDIAAITGATLSARAVLECARRNLAFHQVLLEIKAAKEKKQKEREAKKKGAGSTQK